MKRTDFIKSLIGIPFIASAIDITPKPKKELITGLGWDGTDKSVLQESSISLKFSNGDYFYAKNTEDLIKKLRVKKYSVEHDSKGSLIIKLP